MCRAPERIVKRTTRGRLRAKVAREIGGFVEAEADGPLGHQDGFKKGMDLATFVPGAHPISVDALQTTMRGPYMRIAHASKWRAAVGDGAKGVR